MLSSNTLINLFFFVVALQFSNYNIVSARDDRPKKSTRLRRPLDQNSIRQLKSGKGKGKGDSGGLFVVKKESISELKDEDLFHSGVSSMSLSISLSYSMSYALHKSETKIPLFVTVEKQADGSVRASISNDLPPTAEMVDEDVYPSMSMSVSLSYSYNYGGTTSNGGSKPPTVSPKTSWPECVKDRLTCIECQNLIIAEGNQHITIIAIVPAGSPVTEDYRTERVRIFCKNNTVTDTPVIG
jgi:hypothetical protein